MHEKNKNISVIFISYKIFNLPTLTGGNFGQSGQYNNLGQND